MTAFVELIRASLSTNTNFPILENINNVSQSVIEILPVQQANDRLTGRHYSEDMLLGQTNDPIQYVPVMPEETLCFGLGSPAW
jgi:hypothetical protein